MLITITRVDAKVPRQVGFTRMLGFPVEFSAGTTSGTAIFVPASGQSDGLLGQSFHVEIDQEVVSDLRIVGADAQEEFSSLGERGSFRVCGVVSTVVPLSEPTGAEIISVTASDAMITISKDDLGEARPSKGDKLMFTVREVSLWDEAI
jgi:hypothetical protein